MEKMEKQTTKNFDEIVELLKTIKPTLEKKYHLKSIGVFGSYARYEQKPDSDLDILIELSEPIGLFSYIAMERELSECIGIKVDLVMKDSLKPRIGQYILKEVITV
jgi:predicted nucleotidyltransferase